MIYLKREGDKIKIIRSGKVEEIPVSDILSEFRMESKGHSRLSKTICKVTVDYIYPGIPSCKYISKGTYTVILDTAAIKYII